MRYLFHFVAAVSALVSLSGIIGAQELLTNPSLELEPPMDGGRYTVAPGWATSEGPPVPAIPPPEELGDPDPMEEGDYNDNGIVDAADYVVWRHGGPLLNEVSDATPGEVTSEDYDAWRARFNNGSLSMSEPSNFGHLSFDGLWQHWFQPYLGTDAKQEDNFADLYQDVPGTPGMRYTMTAHALFEDFFPGGVENLNLTNPDETPSGSPFDDGPASPTDAFLALEFRDAGRTVLPGSVEIELKAAGQPSNTMWTKHTLSAVAPTGTASVRVRASMIDGVYNPLPSPQVFQMSFFVDGFSLTATTPMSGQGLLPTLVPEPAGIVVAWILLSGIVVIRPRILEERVRNEERP